MKIILSILTFMFSGGYVIHITVLIKALRANDLCTLEDVVKSEEVYHIYRVYATMHIIASAIINTWLIIATLKTLDIINKGVGNVFAKEKRRIKCINWTFAATYSSWMVYDIVLARTGLPN